MSQACDNKESRPRVSLVIPVRDEARTVQSLLGSIAAQTLPPDEIVFVDGGSADDTAERLRAAAADDARVRIIETGGASPGRGRNVGIAEARCEWVALTDAGIRLEPAWLERLVDVVLADPSTDVVFGNYEPIIESFFERCAALAYVSPKQVRPGGRMRGPFVASSLLRRGVWHEVGGFPDLRAAEDMIFIEAIRENGYRIGWAPTATVWWQLRPTLGMTFKRFALYSRHNVWAGRQWEWHYGVARQYLLVLPFLVLALAHSPWWLVLPLLLMAARIAKSIWHKREGRGLLWALNPAQFALVGVILLTTDLATFVGWAHAMWHRPRSGPRSRLSEEPPKSQP